MLNSLSNWFKVRIWLGISANSIYQIHFEAYFIFMSIFKSIINFSEYLGLRDTVTRFQSWRLIVKKFVMIFINRKANKVNLIFGYVWSLPKLYETDALTLTDQRKK